MRHALEVGYGGDRDIRCSLALCHAEPAHVRDAHQYALQQGANAWDQGFKST